MATQDDQVKPNARARSRRVQATRPTDDAAALHGHGQRLDRDVAKLLIAATDVGRTISHELRRLSRKHNLSERALTIITMVNSGLNRPSMLIKYFGVLPSTITSETDRLVGAGLIERRAHASDRRVSELLLTETGQALRAEALAVLNHAFRMRLEHVGQSDVQTTIATLRALFEPSMLATPLVFTD